ncbi:MAG: methyltransferase [Bacteroidetes bacterium]|jgi:tRNA1Val (adenine37-N6)-methyltransferase|nr:methyltransferase [Bacteroidota bacterium]
MRQSKVFQFKQFSVDQSGCAMKINTDGVLLGALAEADHPQTILDIGTCTGVIALMLAQRFPSAKVDAVEIDQSAAETAGRNFQNSSFADRLNIYPIGFAGFFDQNPDKKYDLIVSNPPFYINSLKSPQENKQLAKHADKDFFEGLINAISSHLNSNGLFCLILPIDTAVLIEQLAAKTTLHLQRAIKISSFENSEPHRLIMYFGFDQRLVNEDQFVIYKSLGNYTEEYINLLKPYFIAF